MKFTLFTTIVVACVATLVSAAPVPEPAQLAPQNEAREAKADPQCLRRFCA
ncbi:hypothetical protein CC1G_11363 [Coprinopsis cinerea okayama7|uniref:Uncharacterized protein n=1 Tax=Coprinopsis cinerea (strain Okayama-7 / 130 / ATCC MYA-4618 / FGSC 9003) TaxID=240176 RepID=A8P8W9_COPC7|nr:hypothetical protein CC1G_11363 [Coprinopsis cinerea okayama7\|eukprot:XP_001839652.1 hypothetical protein CC1G_11363 [Coprinopsis cinerea okayama7\